MSRYTPTTQPLTSVAGDQQTDRFGLSGVVSLLAAATVVVTVLAVPTIVVAAAAAGALGIAVGYLLAYEHLARDSSTRPLKGTRPGTL